MANSCTTRLSPLFLNASNSSTPSPHVFADMDEPNVHCAADFSFEPHHQAPQPESPLMEDESEEEEDRDSQGCKHVYTGLRIDSPYSCGAADKTRSTVSKSKYEHERDVEAKFRNYIKNHIPNGLFLDPYGQVVPIEELKQYQLVQMQAKSWREVPRIWAASRKPPENPTEDDALVADVINCIAEKLAKGKSLD